MATPQETLRAAMDAAGMYDNDLRAGLAAIVGHEGGFRPVPEIGYAHTDNARIRRIFGAARSLSDVRLDALKCDDRAFFEAMYGVGTEAGRQLGNVKPGDGYKYRGRWQIQLTGRANYVRYLTKAGRPELIEDPDRAAADIDLGACLAVVYMLDRYHGGGFDAMKRAVGNSVGGPDAGKNALYAQYRRTGEWDYRGAATAHARPVLARGARGDAVAIAQRDLIAAGYDCGHFGADGDFGGMTEAAVRRFQMNHGLPATGVIDAATWSVLG